MQREIRVQCKDYTQDVAMPLVSGDYNAYVIVMPVSSADNVTGFMVAAQKPDGVVITDIGTVQDNVCRYTIKTNIYDVPGEVIIRVSPMSYDAKLTVCELRCTAIAAFAGSSEVPSDRVPALTAAVAYAQEMGDYAAAQGAKIDNLGLPESLESKADKSSPIINDKLYIQTGENNGTTPTAPHMSIFPTSEGACIRFGENQVMTPTLKITDGGLIFNQDTDDHRVYTEQFRPPASARSRTSTSGEIDCKSTALWILKLSSTKKLTILNPWYYPRGSILIPSGYVAPILPTNSIKAEGFPATVTAPAHLDFIYDGTNYWWTCTKYNA